jgi:hypothetical protein
VSTEWIALTNETTAALIGKRVVMRWRSPIDAKPGEVGPVYYIDGVTVRRTDSDEYDAAQARRVDNNILDWYPTGCGWEVKCVEPTGIYVETTRLEFRQ